MKYTKFTVLYNGFVLRIVFERINFDLPLNMGFIKLLICIHAAVLLIATHAQENSALTDILYLLNAKLKTQFKTNDIKQRMVYTIDDIFGKYTERGLEEFEYERTNDKGFGKRIIHTLLNSKKHIVNLGDGSKER